MMSHPVSQAQLEANLPPRLPRVSALQGAGLALFLYLLYISFQGAEVSIGKFLAGIPEMKQVLQDMFPPDLSRVQELSESLFETLQMALVGTVLGIVVSLPLAAFACRDTTPNKVLYVAARGIISLFRTIPDLVWALFFVVTVGVGAFAGVLTLMVDTIGFCGRFFAESMEEVDKGSSEALRSLGAKPSGILISCVFPAALPSFVNSALFSLEKAVRSSVVLGLVGAGGIGIELKVAMDSFRFDQALTVMLCIFLLVIIVERLSSSIRKRIM